MSVVAFLRARAALAACLLACAGPAQTPPAADPAEALSRELAGALNALEEREASEREVLGTSYRAAVERNRGDAQARGDLDAVVAWKAELARVDQWPVIQIPSTFSLQPAVLAYQQRLAALLTARDATQASARRVILEKFAAALDAHIRDLVRGDRIDDALRLRPRLEEARAELAALPAPAVAAPAPTVTAPAPSAPPPTPPEAAVPGLPRLLAEITPSAKPGADFDASDDFAGRWKTTGQVWLAQTLAGPAVFLGQRGSSLELPALEELRGAGRSFTVAYWVFLMSAHRTAQVSLGEEDSPDLLRIGNMGLNKVRFQAGEDVLEGEANWRLWDWNHVVCVKDSAGQQLVAFVNGQPAGVRPESKDNLHNLHHRPLFIGHPKGAPPPGFIGMVARVRLHEGAMTAPQISSLHLQDRTRLDEARTQLRAKPPETPEQLAASLHQRLVTLSNRERPRRQDEDPVLMLRANGRVSGPWEGTWKALSKDTIDIIAGANHHELKLEVPPEGPRIWSGEHKGPAADLLGRARSGYILE